MHIQKLTENRIQVTVTLLDLMSFNMTMEQLRPDSQELNNFLFYVLQAIYEETDFDPFSGQIMMEATPSEDSVHIIVSKVPREKSLRGRKIRYVGVKQKTAYKSFCFYFESFEDVCGALSEVGENAAVKCELYFLEGVYCVLMRGSDELEAARMILREHSFRQGRHSMRGDFIREHGRYISSGEKLLNIIDTFKNN